MPLIIHRPAQRLKRKISPAIKLATDLCPNQFYLLKPNTMEENIISLKKTARITGLLYFVFALIAIYGYMYVGQKIFVAGNTAATAENMLANEFLFRTSLAGDIITNILFVVVIIFLYRLLRQTNETQAMFMAAFAAVAIPVTFAGEALQVTALQIFKGELLKSFQPEQAQETAALLLKIGNNIGRFITFHWGLWLIPMGLLVYRSGFIPRILGILLWINGLGYMISSFTSILIPAYLETINKIVYPTYFAGEIPLLLWLMIKGVKTKTKSNPVKNQ
jgi:hypothetical protein